MDLRQTQKRFLTHRNRIRLGAGEIKHDIEKARELRFKKGSFIVGTRLRHKAEELVTNTEKRITKPLS